MYLIQYLPYAVTLIFILLPAVLLGLRQRSLNFYGISGSFLLLVVVFGASPKQFFYLLGAFLWSMTLIQAALLWENKLDLQSWSLFLFLLAALFPILLKPLFLPPSQSLPLCAAAACFSLKTIQVLLSIYSGQIREYPAGECAGFLLFFPGLFLGPLQSSRQFHRAWIHTPSAKSYLRLVYQGLWELFWGILYLPFVSHILFLLLEKLEARILEGFADWYFFILYPVLYGIWFFFLLAGFSRLASGCACLLGVRLPKNFRKPYLSLSIRTFWRRWQRIFSCWLKALFYVPLVKKSRQSSCPLLWKHLIWILTLGAFGLLLGNRLSWLLFALYHGLLLCLQELWEQKLPFHQKWKDQSVYRFFSWLVTMCLVFFGFFLLSGMFPALLSL